MAKDIKGWYSKDAQTFAATLKGHRFVVRTSVYTPQWSGFARVEVTLRKAYGGDSFTVFAEADWSSKLRVLEESFGTSPQQPSTMEDESC